MKLLSSVWKARELVIILLAVVVISQLGRKSVSHGNQIQNKFAAAINSTAIKSIKLSSILCQDSKPPGDMVAISKKEETALF